MPVVEDDPNQAEENLLEEVHCRKYFLFKNGCKGRKVTTTFHCFVTFLQLSHPTEEATVSAPISITSPLTLPGSSGSVDYVANPDFNCQEYYNWLSNFAELSKLVPVPLDLDLFQKISQVWRKNFVSFFFTISAMILQM